MSSSSFLGSFAFYQQEIIEEESELNVHLDFSFTAAQNIVRVV
jgi:hypothetical protein